MQSKVRAEARYISSIMRHIVQSVRRYTNRTSLHSDLYIYEAFYLGDEKNKVITGKIVSYVSNHHSLYYENL
jgi:hypothetical protein